MYSKEEGNHFIYVALYLDDMLSIGNNMDVIKEVKMELPSKFEMKYISYSNLIMGIYINREWAVRKLWLK